MRIEGDERRDNSIKIGLGFGAKESPVRKER